jgi:hypothetical protein
MNIYQAEKDAGLTDLLSAKSSIVYASLLEKSTIDINNNTRLVDNKAFAGIEDSDLYYTQSILVTTSWNKNDDIFDPKEVWLAKSTPTHKPTNLEHDESLIVGHITSNWPIEDNGQLIEDNTDINNLPEKFHILTGSVIYKGYTEPDLRDRALTLIDEIESGNKYVSMECFFKGFDYGLINQSTGQYNVLSRNEETAFLTKFLRAYGGEGQHQNYKIGRVLRDITFSGKGFVNRPANPDSIIFTKDNLPLSKEVASIQINEEKKDDFLKEGVFSNQANLKETNMSIESETVQPEVAEITVETPTIETPVAETQAEVETVQAETEEVANQTAEEMKRIQAALDSALETIAAYKKTEEEAAKKAKKTKKVASLVEAGIAADLADSAADKFESLDDEVFSTVLSLVAAKKATKDETDEEEKKEEEAETTEQKTKEKKEMASVDVSALETAEVEESVNLSVGNDQDSQIHNTRAALVDFVCIRLGKKLNKGE